MDEISFAAVEQDSPHTATDDKSSERDELCMKCAQLVLESRKRAGLSQLQLATIVGTAPSVISDLERGKRLPKITTLQRIATALGQPFELRLGQAVFLQNPLAS